MVCLLQKPRHTKENCGKPNGKLPQFFGRDCGNRNAQSGQQNGQVNIVHSEYNPHPENTTPTTLEINGFNREEIEQLGSLLTSLENPKFSCSLALSGKYSLFHSFSASKDCFSSTCVINSSAIDHKTTSSN